MCVSDVYTSFCKLLPPAKLAIGAVLESAASLDPSELWMLTTVVTKNERGSSHKLAFFEVLNVIGELSVKALSGNIVHSLLSITDICISFLEKISSSGTISIGCSTLSFGGGVDSTFTCLRFGGILR